MKRLLAYLVVILCLGLNFNVNAKDFNGLLNALEISKKTSSSIDLDKKSKEYGYKNFKSFVKDFKKKNKIKRLSVEDAIIYFAGYDPNLEIKETKENKDKLHQLILSNKIFKNHSDYLKKKNSNKLKWLAVSVDYKKEMSKITENPGLKKISPFAWGWGSYASGAISACEREKDYLGLKIGPECILVDISKSKQHINVITPNEKIEMCKENSLMLFPDLFKIPDLDTKSRRYKSYCTSDLFSLAGVAEIDRTIDRMLQEIEENKYLYVKLTNSISSDIKKTASSTKAKKLKSKLVITNDEINKSSSNFISLAFDKKTATRYIAYSKRSKDHADTNALFKCKYGVQSIEKSRENECEIVDRVDGKEKRVIKDNTQIVKKEPTIQSKKKVKVAKIEKSKQEEFKPKNKDKDNEAPIIEIAEAITVNDSNYKFEGRVSDQSKNIFIEVDGQLVDVKNGVFKVVGYSPVDKNIKIEAIDGYGNRSKPKIVKLTIDIKETEVVEKIEPLNPSNLNTEISNNKVALIFGIENYSDSPKAQFANLDAKYFYDYARKAFGVNKQNIKILVDQDATFIETNKVITKWLRSKIVEGESELIIFFAGHGLASPNGKELFLLSHDSDPDLLDITALSRTKLFESIMSFNPSSVTMFLDTCYSGVSRDEEMLLASARPIRVVADDQDESPSNFSIFSASKLDQISSGLSQAKHGIFSYYLMKGLEGKADLNNDKQITNGELLAYMDKNVSKKAAEQGRDQNPSFTGDPDKILVTLN